MQNDDLALPNFFVRPNPLSYGTYFRTTMLKHSVRLPNIVFNLKTCTYSFIQFLFSKLSTWVVYITISWFIYITVSWFNVIVLINQKVYLMHIILSPAPTHNESLASSVMQQILLIDKLLPKLYTSLEEAKLESCMLNLMESPSPWSTRTLSCLLMQIPRTK